MCVRVCTCAYVCVRVGVRVFFVYVCVRVFMCAYVCVQVGVRVFFVSCYSQPDYQGE